MADVWVGCDLGQLVDPSAISVMARSLAIDANGLPARTSRGRLCYRFDVMALRRFAIGTPYAQIVNHVVDVLLRPEMGEHPQLCLDNTGVGGPIVEQFRTALSPYPRIDVHALTITAGRSWSVVGRNTYHVAKIELVAAVREALELRRFKLARRNDGTPIDHADILKQELLNFRVKITANANETFNAREGTHDDLVLAVALPIWLASSLPKFEMSICDGRPRETTAWGKELARVEEEEMQALALDGIGPPERVKEALRRRDEAFERDPWNPRNW